MYCLHNCSFYIRNVLTTRLHLVRHCASTVVWYLYIKIWTCPIQHVFKGSASKYGCKIHFGLFKLIFAHDRCIHLLYIYYSFFHEYLLSFKMFLVVLYSLNLCIYKHDSTHLREYKPHSEVQCSRFCQFESWMGEYYTHLGTFV